MSDLQNMDGSPIEDGAQADVLSSDQERKSTHGGVFNQNQMADCVRGPNVEASSQPKASRNGLSDGLGVSGVNVAVRHVDQRTIEGSYAADGDTRKKGAPAVLPENPGPREGMTQARLNSKTPAASAPKTFPEVVD